MEIPGRELARYKDSAERLEIPLEEYLEKGQAGNPIEGLTVLGLSSLASCLAANHLGQGGIRMSQLATCCCHRCGTEFTVSSDVVEDIDELSCPLCERPVAVPDDDDEDDDEDLEPAAANPRRRRR